MKLFADLINTLVDHIESLRKTRDQQVEEQQHNNNAKKQHESPRNPGVWQRSDHICRLGVEHPLYQCGEKPVGCLHSVDGLDVNFAEAIDLLLMRNLFRVVLDAYKPVGDRKCLPRDM